MREQILEILMATRPEFDFAQEDINFVEEGYLDSFDIVTIVSDLEEAFDIKIDGASILPENFKDVESIEQLIKSSR